MIHLRREFCAKVKMARREAGLSQSVLAAEVGCKQSALSMFEQGDGTKLNEEVIGKLSKKFGIPLESEDDEGAGAGAAVLPRRVGLGVKGFCPNPSCPTNEVYEVEGKKFARPNRGAADPVGGKFCAVCGEVLEKACPNCGAAVHEGAVCSFCGAPYVAIV